MHPDFFVVGAPRSGTTLLRTMLNGHPQLHVPAETNFLPRLIQGQALWWRGERLDVSLFARLVCANGRLALSGLYRADVEAVLRNTPVDSPRAAVHALYTLLGEGASVVGDKSPSYCLATASFDRFFGRGVSYVHVVRHPLAVTASLMQQPWAPNSADLAAMMWRRYVVALDRLLDDPRCMTVRLEDLVAHPEAQLTKIAAHLGIDYTHSMLGFGERAQSVQEANFYPTSHTGLVGPLRETRNWRSQLAEVEQARAWALTGDLARRYGYVEAALVPRRSRAVGVKMLGFRLTQQWRRARTVRNLLNRRG